MMLHGKFLKIEPISAPDKAVLILKALGSEQRLRVLEFVGNRRCSVTEIAQGLDLPLSTTTAHVNILQDAGLLHTEIEAASRGVQKVCNRTYDQLLIDLTVPTAQNDRAVTVSMPVGHFSRCEITPTCGLAGPTGLIGMLDDPMAFYDPSRIEAQLLWFRSGYVEYYFPNGIPPRSRITALTVSVELCSEAPLHNMDWPSDITLWINDVEVGTWTSPADFGGIRGHLTPAWWDDKDTQFGLLKRFQVNTEGAFVDGIPLSTATLADLRITDRQPIRIRFGVKADAQHAGGLNLFGSAFGNYPQDLILRLDYEPQPSSVHYSASAADAAAAGDAQSREEVRNR